MGMKWSGAAAVLMAAAAHAEDKGQFQVTPYLGFSNVEVKGRHLEFGDSQGYDGWTIGLSAGYRTSFGLVAEIGTSASGDLFVGWVTGGELREDYLAAGYDLEFGDGWHFTPKAGVTRWTLKAGELEDLVDDSGELRDELDGTDLFGELGLTRDLGSHAAIGISVRGVGADFGSAVSAAFRFTWGF